MSSPFDPHYRWLGIPPEEQPADHYRLLGVRRFESDPEVISNAADRQMLHIRSFQTGPHSAECQRLLNELAAARTNLLEAPKKARYDQTLAPLAGARPAVQPAAPIATAAPTPVPAAIPLRPVPLPTAQPQAPGSPQTPSIGTSAFPTIGKSTRGSHARRRPRSSWVAVALQGALVGGAAIGLTLAILYFGFGADPLGLAGSPAPEHPIAQLPAEPDAKPPLETPPIANPETPEAAPAPVETTTPKPAAGPTKKKKKKVQPASQPGAGSSGAESGDDITDMLSLGGDPQTPRPAKTPALGGLDPANQKAPIPSEQEQREERQKLRDAVGGTLTASSSREERQARLTALGKLANDLAGDPPALYVTLQEAYEEAGKLGLYDDARRVIQRLIDRFQVDEVGVRSQLIKDFAQIARQDEERMTLANDALTLAESAYAKQQYGEAASLATLAEGQAAKADNAAVRTLGRERSLEYRRAERAVEAYEKSLETLAANPDSPRANVAVGRFLTLFLGDFSKGIPHLAKGDDPRLKSLAERDLAGAVASEDQLALGDAWFELASKDAEFAPLCARAKYWYRLAETGASGLVSASIRRRQEQIEQLEAVGKFTDRTASATSSEPPLFDM